MVVNKLVDYILRFLIVCVTLLSHVCNKANHTEPKTLCNLSFPRLINWSWLGWKVLTCVKLSWVQLHSLKHQFSLQPVWLEDGSFMFTIVSFSSFLWAILILFTYPCMCIFLKWRKYHYWLQDDEWHKHNTEQKKVRHERTYYIIPIMSKSKSGKLNYGQNGQNCNDLWRPGGKGAPGMLIILFLDLCVNF